MRLVISARTLRCAVPKGEGGMIKTTCLHLSEGAYIKIRNRAQKKEGAFCALLRLLERETGFGPATSTLARWHSTTESLPQISGF